MKSSVTFCCSEYEYLYRPGDYNFGKATLIETSGGGIEAGEDLQSAIRRELNHQYLKIR